MPLPLAPAEIHLWQAFQHASPHASLLDEYGACLSDDERQREAKFHFEHDRVRFRVTRAMVRRVLSAYLGIAPESCRFEANAHGRPALVNPEALRERLQFNVSHSEEIILLGVTRGRELGLDVERVSAKRASAALATRYFSAAESVQVLNAPAEQRDDLFCQYWTLKESYMKARGLGFALPLGKFGFTLNEGRARLWVDPQLGDTAERWEFLQFRPDQAHHAAICVERVEGSAPNLRLHDFATLALASPQAQA